MASTQTPPARQGWQAPDFSLKGTDGLTHSLADLRGENGLVVMFICNHCPYVQAVLEPMIRDMSELKAYGIGSVAIMPNDATAYPADGFERMRELAEAHRFPFPYLLDDTQQTAKAYNAVCTPDFFGFDSALRLQYRGRLDASGRMAAPDARRELFEAMVQVAQTGKAPAEQFHSIGCSIKWK
jgi:peroxiredoxin